MCIAILKPKGAKITTKALEKSFDNNKDGAGIAYTKDNQIYIVKGIFSKKKFIKAVRNAEKEADGDMLIHCRIATSGNIDEENCHPHKVNENCVLIHNGVLSADTPGNSEKSDTIIFIEKYLRPLKKTFYKDKALMSLTEKAIGSCNKFVILDYKGKGYIINEKAGYWDNGVWYSNKSYNQSKIVKFAKQQNLYYPKEYGWKNKWYEDDFYDSLKTARLDKKLIKEEIYTMSTQDLMNLGMTPVWDTYYQKLERGYGYWEDSGRVSLEDIDKELYNTFLQERNYRSVDTEEKKYGF